MEGFACRAADGSSLQHMAESTCVHKVMYDLVITLEPEEDVNDGER